MADTTAGKKYLEELVCTIDLDDSRNFARIWIGCLLCAICILAFVTVPYYWFGSGERDKGEKAAALGVEEEGGVEKGGAGEGEDRPPAPPGEDRPPTPPPVEPIKWETPGGKPDYDLAWKYCKSLMALTPEGKTRSVFSTSVPQLADVGGVGTELYFRLMRHLGFCLAYMAVITAPMVVFNAWGAFKPENAANPFVSFTIGNVGLPSNQTDADVADRYIIIGCQAIQLFKLTPVFGWLDMTSVMIFLIFVAWFRFRILPKRVELEDKANISSSDFALCIHGLPQKIDDHANYEKLLSEHLSSMVVNDPKTKQFFPKANGKVCEVALVRDYGKRLTSMLEVGRLQKALVVARESGNAKREAKLQKQVDKNALRLNKKLGSDEELPVLRAYVIMDTTQDIDALNFVYRFAKFKLFRCCQSQVLRFKGKAIYFTKATEPSNILWENADVPLWERRVRGGLSLSLVCLFLLISLLGMWGTFQGKKILIGSESADGQPCDVRFNLTKYNASDSLVANFDPTIFKTRTEYNSGEDKEAFETCWCAGVGIAKVGEAYWNGDWKWCESFVFGAAKVMGTEIGVSLAVIIINALLKFLLLFLAHFQKPMTISALNASIMGKVFLAQFVNIAIICLIINFVDGSVYFDRDWYAITGAALLMNMLTNAVVPNITPVFLWFFRNCQQCCGARCASHQSDLVDMLTPPPFDISTRFAQVLMTVCATLIYSSGMPVLNMFCVVFLFSAYWADKIILLKASKRPPMFDASMPKLASEYLMIAAVLHCVVGVLMFGKQDVFPSESWSSELESVKELAAAQVDEGAFTKYFNEGISRLTKKATVPIFLVFLVYVVFSVLRIVAMIVGGGLSTFLTFMKDACGTCCRSAAKVEPGDDDDLADKTTFTAVRVEMERAEGRPPSYQLSMNPDYAELFARMKEARESNSPEKTAAPDSAPAAPHNEEPPKEPIVADI